MDEDMMELPVASRFAKDRGGNFGIMTAVLLPVLFGAAGVAVDVSSGLQVRSQMQGLIDAATLATASAMADQDMTETEAETFGTSYFLGQAAQNTAPPAELAAEKTARELALKDGLSATATVTNASGNARTYNIKMTMNYKMPLSGLSRVLGLSTMQIGVSSASQSGREGNALSMYLALDESGSMAELTTTVNPAQPTKDVTTTEYGTYVCGGTTRWPTYCYGRYNVTNTVPNYLSKMASLKAAGAAMFAELSKADPTSELIRVGATSYDDQTKAEQAIKWGTKDVATYVKNLPEPPAGGTDASGAMTNAFNALKAANAAEKTAHAPKGNTSFERFIVLMTDGEMTGYSANWNSTIDDKVRALCKQSKDDGIKIYTIAFMAPTRGKSLLSNCATSDDYYYEPTDMTTLVQSFGDIARKAAKTDTRLTN
jgi:Flp pilus assembly protein TadG